MISIFEGTLGSSKTYHATCAMLGHMAKGGIVATNIKLVWDKVEWYMRVFYRVKVKAEQYVYVTDVSRFNEETPAGSDDLPTLAVLDEFHLWFFCRDYAKVERTVQDFITQSRKLNIDIIMIAQHADNIDKIFRRQVERYFMFRDMRKWKIPGLGMKWPLPQFLQVELDRDRRTVLERKWELIDTQVFKCFESKQLLRPVLCGAKREKVVVERVYMGGGKMKWIFGVAAGIAVMVGVKFWRSAEASERQGYVDRATELERQVKSLQQAVNDADSRVQVPGYVEPAGPAYVCAAVVYEKDGIRLYNDGAWATVSNSPEDWNRLRAELDRVREEQDAKRDKNPKHPFSK
jgi:zona occludens toxin (predicted ATPase)